MVERWLILLDMIHHIEVLILGDIENAYRSYKPMKYHFKYATIFRNLQCEKIILDRRNVETTSCIVVFWHVNYTRFWKD